MPDRTSFRRLLTIGACFTALLALPAAAHAVAAPTVSFGAGAPTSPMLGTTTDVVVSFDNPDPALTGFGPYVDLVYDDEGADGVPGVPGDEDGLTIGAIQFAGSTVTPVSIECTGATFDHPFAKTVAGTPVQVTAADCPAGSTFLYVPLPFGSFAPDQPVAQLTIPFTTSTLADLPGPLDVKVRGGYRFGGDPLDNPTSDPSVVGGFSTHTFTPTVFEVRKRYVGPEGETATGPNFQRSYRIDVDIADGQTISAVQLADALPEGIVYRGAVATNAGVVSNPPVVDEQVDAATPDLTVTWPSLVGGPSDVDATVTVNFYVPHRYDGTAAQVLTNAADEDFSNQATGTGMWDPLDPRDVGLSPVSDTSDADAGTMGDQPEVFEAEALAIQKGYVNADADGNGLDPGDVLTYTIQGQVSDYYALDNLVVEDVMADGLRRFAPAEDPQIAINGVGFTIPAGPSADYDYDLDTPTAGKTRWRFHLSDHLAGLRAGDTRLLGGCIPPAGTADPEPDSQLYADRCAGGANDGPTTFTITYRAVVQDVFTGPVTGTPSIDPGDGISNAATAAADVLDTAALVDSGLDTDDDTGSSGTIVGGAVTKRIYAINGSTAGYPFSEPDVRPGDTVTYYIAFQMPTGDVEDLQVDEFLPQPVLDVAELGAAPVQATKAWTVPAAGAVQIVGPGTGPVGGLAGDTFSDTSGDATGLSNLVPSFSSDAVSNSFRLTYGNYSDPTNTATTLAFLTTLTVGTEPFADDLLLTNQVEARTKNTGVDVARFDAYDRFHLREPELAVRKGVATTDNAADDTYSPAAPAQPGFSLPGTAGSRLAGPITPAQAATIDKNVSNLDDDDLVTFAITIPNSGGSTAYDVRVRDTLPAGFSIPGGAGLNLDVRLGSNPAAAYASSAVGGGLFDPAGGVEIDEIPAGDVAIVTYDLQVDYTVVGTAITNTANVSYYTNIDGGTNFVGGPIEDTASATVSRTPTVVKDVTSPTTPFHATIGQVLQYRTRITLREGQLNSAQLVDTLPSGLAFADPDVYPIGVATGTTGGALTPTSSTLGALPIAALAGGQFTLSASGGQSDRVLTIPFGTLTNPTTSNAGTSFIDVTYSVVVTTAAPAHSPTTDRTNTANLTYTGGNQSDTAVMRVVEPRLTVTKTPSSALIDSDDVVTWTVVVTADGTNSRTDAFDVTVTDPIPAGLTYVTGSLTCAGGGTCNPALASPLSVTYASIPAGASRTITFQTTVDNATAIAGQLITNTATATYDSLAGDVSATRCENNANCVERDYSAPGSGAVTIAPPAITKALVSTDQAHTTGQSVVVGERARYTVAIPVSEGVTQDLEFEDTLDRGLAFVDAPTSSVTVSFDDGNGGPLVPLVPFGGPTITNNADAVATPGGVLAIDFDDFNNTENDGNVERIVITYDVQVVDSAYVQTGTTLGNAALIRYFPPGGPTATITATPPADLTVVEPAVTIAKTLTYETTGGDDLVRVDLAVANPAAGSTRAFDIDVTDVLTGTGLEYVGTPAPTCAPVACDAGPSHAAGTVTATIAQLDPSQTTNVRFYAKVAATQVAGTDLDNEASLVWSTLAGNQRTDACSGAASCIERNGADGAGGAIDDHEVSDDAQLATTGPTAAKAIVATSAAHTTGSNVVVGERVQYRVTVTLPRGTTRDLRIVDTLQRGLALDATPPVLAATGFDTTPAPTLTLPPVTSVIGNATGADPEDRVLTIDLGDVANGEADTAAETITATYWAVVTDTAYVNGATTTPTVTAATTADNAAHLVYTPVAVDVTTADVHGGAVTVLEPQLRITKTIIPALLDAGQVATIRLDIAHTGNSTADALGVVVNDPLPSRLRTGGVAWVSGFTPACTITGTGGASGTQGCVSNLMAGTLMQATFDTIPLGATRRIEFTVMVDPAIAPAESVSNTGYVDWRSLPTGTGDTSACTTAPCVARTGDYTTPADPVDDYTNSSTAVVAGATISTIGGHVWEDQDNDGVRDGGEPCIDGVTVTLTGTDLLGNPVTRTTTTGANGAAVPPLVCGEYRFENLRPGTYQVAETQPGGYLDGDDVVGHFGDNVPKGNGAVNDRVSNIVLPVGASTTAVDYDFGEIVPATLAGRVWGEANGGPEDGVFNGADTLLAGVTITLTGTDDRGATVTRTATTNASGAYSFTDLRPGTYAVTETQPTDWFDGDSHVGTGATTAGTRGSTNRTQGIVLDQGDAAVAYDFHELVRVNVRIAKEVVAPGAPGGVVGRNTTFTWRVTVTNDGPSPATNVEFTDDLAALAEQHLTVQSVTPSAGTTCTTWTAVSAPNLTCTTAALTAVAPGNSATVDLLVRADSMPPDATPALDNDVAITDVDQVQTTTADDTARSSVQVQDSDIGVTKTVDFNTRFTGQQVVWTVGVRNNGPGTDPAVLVRDQLPGQAVLVSVTTDRGTCSGTSTIDCALGTMVAGDTATITIVAMLPEAGTYVNAATVVTPAIDRDPTNQTATSPVRVRDALASDCTVEDGGGNGTITGTAGDDVICGGGGDDTISCSGGSDIIVAGGGNDTITCTPAQCANGKPTIVAGIGNDVISIGCKGAIVSSGDGDDVITAADSSGPITINGGDGNDTITGSGFADTLCGNAGNDTIRAGGGNDLVDGGAGNDTVFGEAGNDRLYGGLGNDALDGGAGNDKLYGGTGNDKLFGMAGLDTLFGEVGNDTIDGGAGQDSAHGGDGADVFKMKDRTADRIIGARGRDILYRDKRVDRWTTIEVIR